MIRKALTILISFLSILSLAQERVLLRDLYGLRPVKNVLVEEYSWLRTDVFRAMSLHGDTLFISKNYKARTNALDAEAGEPDMLRRKFMESRQIMISNFMDEKMYELHPLKGYLNNEVNSGGLILKRNSLGGMMPKLNYSSKRSSLYYVELENDEIRMVRPWEGNANMDYAYYPAFINEPEQVVFVSKGKDKDLMFWNVDENKYTPYPFNSVANDINPYIFNDSLLFFASDRGHQGDYDLYYHNLNQGGEPKLLFPKQLKTENDELAIAFINDTLSVFSRKVGDVYTYNRLKIDLGYAPNSYKAIPDNLLDKPKNRDAKILREHGRIAKEMFLVNYGEQLTVRKPENLFLDTVPLNPYAVRIIDGVLKKENLIDVSFFLPVEIEDTAFQSETYSMDKTMASGIRKIAQLLKDLKDTHAMIIGFASASGGSDLNLMRAYFQGSSMKMQLNEFYGISESRIHIIAAGDYVNTVHSDLNVKHKNNVGAVYLYRNRKAPELLTAYKMSSIESNEIIANRFGMPLSNLTYANILLKPFLEIPEDLLFIPVKDITMLWKGNDLRETAIEYNVSLNELLRVNGLQEPIIDKQRIIYIP